MAHLRSFQGVWLLLGVALLLRALVPAGWMPDTGRSDGIVVKICNSSATITLPLKNDSAPDRNDVGHKSAPCLFAGFGGDAPLPDADTALPTVAPAEQQAIATLAPLLLARQSFLLPPGRGPPANA